MIFSFGKLNIRDISLFHFWLIISLFYCVTIVGIEFNSVPISNFYSMVSTFMQWLTVSVCTSGLLLLLSLSRIFFAITFPILFIFSSVICYYNLTVGITLTAVSIEIALVNDSTMWMSVVSPLLICVIIISGIISFLAVYFRWKYIKVSQSEFWIGLVSAFLLSSLHVIIPRINGPVTERLPYSIYYAFDKYFGNRAAVRENRQTYVNTECILSTTPPDVILVLGESLRSDHIPQNGYKRNTMPRLSRDSSVISFPNVYSSYTHTYVSVPHIMTKADPINTDAAYSEQSFITLFKKAGYTTAWFANQDLSDSYSYFAHECDSLYYCNAAKSTYSFNKWLDADLLPLIRNWINDKNLSYMPKLAVIHSIGSHWWYKSHYTDRQTVFLPDADNKEMASLTQEQIINSYDNTIIATDDFLADLFTLIKDRNVIVLYISDHGEALGEDGFYLHGGDCKPLHHPACLVWSSSLYAETFSNIIKALKNGRYNGHTSEAIFYTMLEISDIRTSESAVEKSLLIYEK